MPINWDLDDETVADVTTCPPTVDVLAGTFDQWWAIWAIKTIQRAADLPVTGHWDQHRRGEHTHLMRHPIRSSDTSARYHSARPLPAHSPTLGKHRRPQPNG